MEALLTYFGKMILCSAVMLTYYQLFLKDKTFHHYNRFYLLATVAISLFLPFLKTDYFTIEVNPKLFWILQNLKTSETVNQSNHDNLYFTIVVGILGLVSFFILSRILSGLMKIQSLKKHYPKANLEGISFYETDLQNAPFSFFRNLFWKNSILIHSDLGKQILKHEMVHIEQKHSIDRLFMEIITAVFWFNPVFWFIKKEITLIHEYLADKKSVKNMDTKAFAQMLLVSHFSGKVLPATSPFLSSNLKKRLTILKKSKTKFGYARKILALPMLFILAFAYLVNAKNKEIKQTNREIEQTFQTLVKDTIVPNAQKEMEQQQKDMEQAEKDRLQAEKDMKQAAKDAQQAHLDAKQAEKDAKIQAKEAKKLEKQARKEAKKANEYVNSPEFKKQIDEAKEQAQKAKEYVNSPEFKKQVNDAKEEARKAREYVNSPEFKKQIDEAKKAAEEAKKAVDYNGKNKVIVIGNNKNTPRVFLDGKEIPEEEMNKINPNTIESVNVIKKDKTSQGEIYIITKQNALKIPNK